MTNIFRVLILKNDLKIDITDDLQKWASFESRKLGITLEIEQKTTSIKPIAHKSFGVYGIARDIRGNRVSMEMYGLDNIKNLIRATKVVPEGEYHAVIFMYDYEGTDLWRTNPGVVGNWCYFEQIYNGTEFIEIPTTRPWDNIGDLFRVLTHEVRHAYVNRCRRRGVPMADVMDSMYLSIDCDSKQPSPTGKCYDFVPYYKEFEPTAPNGNRATQNILLAPFISKIIMAPELTSYIARLLKQVMDIIEKLKGGDSPGLVKWAEAIKKHEGWFIGSRSYRNNNPGNFRFAPFIKELGAIGEDRKGVPVGTGGYAIFPSYNVGWEALLEFLRTAKKNQLRAYRQRAIDMKRPGQVPTLGDFFAVYAPSSDNNNPLAYAEAVAKHIGNGVTVETSVTQI